MGKLPRARWVLMVGALAVSIAACILAFTYYVRDNQNQERARVIGVGQTTLSNCLQTETVKGQLVAVLEDSLERLPSLDYYKTHPVELKESQDNARESIKRFEPRDCYRLASVREAGIQRPPRGG